MLLQNIFWWHGSVLHHVDSDMYWKIVGEEDPEKSARLNFKNEYCFKWLVMTNKRFPYYVCMCVFMCTCVCIHLHCTRGSELLPIEELRPTNGSRAGCLTVLTMYKNDGEPCGTGECHQGSSRSPVVTSVVLKTNESFPTWPDFLLPPVVLFTDWHIPHSWVTLHMTC